ncbi:MAG: hypothetical protein II371_08180, partial [Flavobacteriales bacterium]|nr:hypothetical protein [Flavobacteriales bacterium]
MNKKVRIAIRILLGVILVVGLLLGLLMVPPVQNYLGRAISHKISQNIPQEISIDTFTVRPSGRVHMAGVLLKDHHDDTLAYIPAVDARIRLSSIFSSRISLGYVLLTSPDVHITHYNGEEKDNLSAFLAYFKKKDEEKKALNMNIARAAIKDAHLRYVKEREGVKEPLDSMAIDDFYLDVRRIRIRENGYLFDIEDITAVSSMGVALEELTMDVDVSPYGITAKDMHIKTTGSDIRGKIALYMPGEGKKDTLSRDVKDMCVDLKIDKAVIDPDDVAYFFPQLTDFPSIHIKTNTSYMAGVARVRQAELWSPNIFKLTAYGDVNVNSDSVSTSTSKLVVSNIDINATRALYYYGLTGLKGFKESDIKKLNALSHITGNAVVNTSPVKADASVTLETFRGKAFAQISADNPWDKDRVRYNGMLSVEDVDVGLLMGSTLFGKLSMYSQLEGKGRRKGKIDARMSSHISSVGIKGYSYSDIDVNTTLNGDTFASHIEINDPNIKATASDTLVRHSGGRYENTLNMYLDRGHLYNLGIIKDSLANLRATIESKITGHTVDDAEGFFTLSEVSYNAGSKYYYISRVEALTAMETDSTRALSIIADDIFD